MRRVPSGARGGCRRPPPSCRANKPQHSYAAHSAGHLHSGAATTAIAAPARNVRPAGVAAYARAVPHRALCCCWRPLSLISLTVMSMKLCTRARVRCAHRACARACACVCVLVCVHTVYSSTIHLCLQYSAIRRACCALTRPHTHTHTHTDTDTDTHTHTQTQTHTHKHTQTHTHTHARTNANAHAHSPTARARALASARRQPRV